MRFVSKEESCDALREETDRVRVRLADEEVVERRRFAEDKSARIAREESFLHRQELVSIRIAIKELENEIERQQRERASDKAEEEERV